MSAQPNLDAKQMQRKQMKFAIPVDNNRHYIIGAIMPRHFVQAAAQAGMPVSAVHELMKDLTNQVPQAIASVVEELPSDFPDQIRASSSAECSNG